MTKTILIGLCVFISMSTNSIAAKWSHQEIRAVGKNLVALTGFYMTCGKNEHITINSKAARWASYMGTKYLVVAGIETEQKKWIIKGSNGTLIKDPTMSEKTMDVKFSKESCIGVKNIIDTQYNVANNYISGSYKKK